MSRIGRCLEWLGYTSIYAVLALVGLIVLEGILYTVWLILK